VVRTNDSKFLGFTFKGTQIHWHPDTLRKFKQRIRELTNRNWGVSMHYQLFKVSQYLQAVQLMGSTSELLHAIKH